MTDALLHGVPMALVLRAASRLVLPLDPVNVYTTPVCHDAHS